MSILLGLLYKQSIVFDYELAIATPKSLNDAFTNYTGEITNQTNPVNQTTNGTKPIS